MDRTAYIHIGTHKTGTTSVQTFLRKNSMALQKCGICVPSAGTISPLSGHHRIPWEFWNDPRLPDNNRESLQHLIAEISHSSCQSAVISAEGLGFLVDQPQNLRYLENTFLQAGWTPVYIVFFRRPDQYATSLYRTLRDLGVHVPLSALIATMFVFGRFRTRRVWSFYADQKKFKKRWQSIAKGEIISIDYDNAKKDSITSAFLTLIGASQLSDLPEEKLNVRPSPVPFSHRILSAPLKWRYGSDAHEH